MSDTFENYAKGRDDFYVECHRRRTNGWMVMTSADVSTDVDAWLSQRFLNHRVMRRLLFSHGLTLQTEWLLENDDQTIEMKMWFG